MTMELPGADPGDADPDGADPADSLEPLRVVERAARRVATTTVLASLAGVAVAATIPVWSEADRLRPVVAGSYVRQTVLWRWDIAAHDAWWALGLVLLLPCLLAVSAALVARRQLARSAASPLFQVRPTEVAAGPGAGRITEAQRRARERGRREELLTQQRYAVARTRKGSTLWAELGGATALILGVWIGSALALSALGQQESTLGIAMAATSWWIVVVPVGAWYLVRSARRAVVRRRSGTAPASDAPSSEPSVPQQPSGAGQ